MRAVGRAEDRQSVAVGYQAVTRRAKREVALARQRDSERAPVQSAVEETEAARVDIAEDAAVVQDREVERYSFDVGGDRPICAAARSARTSMVRTGGSVSESTTSIASVSDSVGCTASTLV
jgi:hypothetical protein